MAAAAAAAGTAVADERPRPTTLREWIGVEALKRREPGIRAAFFAVMFAVGMYVVGPFMPVEVDDRGEVLPNNGLGQSYKGLYMAWRSLERGTEVTSHNASAWSVSGPGMLLVGAIPLLAVAGIYLYFRRNGKHLPLTIGMVVVFLLYMMSQSVLYIPILIALAIASFQVRRAEMNERVAQEAAARGEAGDEPEDAEAEPEDVVEDEDVEDGYEDDEYTDELEDDDLTDEDEDELSEYSEYEDGDIYDEFEDEEEDEGSATEPETRPRS